MICLTEEDKEQIKYDEWDKVVRFDLSEGSHYAKFTDQTGAFRELFGKKIFDKIGISLFHESFYLLVDAFSIQFILVNQLHCRT